MECGNPNVIFESADKELHNTDFKLDTEVAFSFLWLIPRSPRTIKKIIEVNSLKLDEEYKHRKSGDQSLISGILEHTYDTSMLRLMLENGADPNLEISCIWNSWDIDRNDKPIPSFFCVNTEEQLDVLVEFGVDINKKDARGRSLFQYSLINRHSNIAYYLLKKYNYQPTFQESRFIVYKPESIMWYIQRIQPRGLPQDNHDEYDPQKRSDLLREICSSGVIKPNSKIKNREGDMVDLLYVADDEEAIYELVAMGAAPIGKDKYKSYLKQLYGNHYNRKKNDHKKLIDLHEYLYTHPYKRTKRAVV
jgi:hypothetical protein